MGSGRIKQKLRLVGIGVSCRDGSDTWWVLRQLQAHQELGTKQNRAVATEEIGLGQGQAAKLMGVSMSSPSGVSHLERLGINLEAQALSHPKTYHERVLPLTCEDPPWKANRIQ